MNATIEIVAIVLDLALYLGAGLSAIWFIHQLFLYRAWKAK